MIYGDVGAFIGDKVLAQFDVITASERMLVGHFTLIRNTPALKVLYRQCDNYLEKLCSPQYEVFDEKDFSVLVSQQAFEGRLSLYQRSIQTDDCIIWWAGRSRFLILWWQGKLIDLFSLRRLSYFHFIQSKHKPYFQTSAASGTLGCFFIDNCGIHPVDGIVSGLGMVLSAARTFAFTVPWYMKNVLKIFLPAGMRLKLRSIVARLGGG